MAPSRLFPANKHLQCPETLQTHSEANTKRNSFTHTSRARLRNSLRKIPSAIFAGLNDVGDTDISPLPSSDTGIQSVVEGKAKDKTRTRKAFASIIKWGSKAINGSKSAAPPKISAPQPLQSFVPSHQSRPVAVPQNTCLPVGSEASSKIDNLPLHVKKSRSVLKKASSLRLQSHPSKLSLSICEHAQPIVAAAGRRPSMGPDPFSNLHQGAAVVEHIQRHGVISVASSNRSGVSRQIVEIESSGSSINATDSM